jgi:Fe-S-cluster containining protein
MRRGIHRHGSPRSRPRDLRDVETRDAELLQVLDAGFERVARRSGTHLACRPGCSECCHGPFPVTPLDVQRLRRGIRTLEQRDPARAAAVRARARAAVATMHDGYPGDSRSGRLDAGIEELDGFFERHGGLACPALDEHGRCELYDHRPVGCRDFGPPLRFDDELVAPCRLCFAEASADEIERCRYEPDPDGLEDGILSDLVDEPGGQWQTLIAFALAEPD